MGVFIQEDGRLRPGWRVTCYLGVYLFGLLVSQTIVVGAWSATMLRRGQVNESQLMNLLLGLHLPFRLFVALEAVDLGWILALTWLFGRFVDRRRLAAYGLQRTTGWLDDTILGLVLGAAQMVVIVCISLLAGWYRVTSLPTGIRVATSRYTALGLLFFGMVAVGEELLFRGYVQTNLQEANVSPPGASLQKSAGAGLQAAPPRRPAALALALSSILFGLFHALNPNLTGLAMLNLVLAGAALGLGYWATGSLWLPIAYHLSWNFVQGPILGLPVSGMRFSGLLIVADWGKAPLWTGHTFGPEGGLLGTAMLLVTVGVFWWRGRRTNASP